MNVGLVTEYEGLSKEVYEKFGKPGSMVAGSQYYRSYCERCHTPMRTGHGDTWSACERCKGELRIMAHPYGLSYKDDPGPMWENIVRAYEDG